MFFLLISYSSSESVSWLLLDVEEEQQQQRKVEDGNKVSGFDVLHLVCGCVCTGME